MLTEKDYCDKDLSATLMEMGFRGFGHIYYEKDSSKLKATHQILTARTAKALGHTLAVSLYAAQKFLREEKKIIIEANFNLMYKGQPRFGWRVLYNLTQHKGAYYTFDSVKSKEDYDSYEEALSECIKEAIEILKEE